MPSLFNRVRNQLSDRQSEHRRIAIGFFWVSLFVFVGKLAGAAKEMTIAWRYGVSALVDGYVLVLNLVTWPVSVWFNVLGIALIPALVRTAHADSAEMPRFRGELMGWHLVAAMGFGLAAWVALPWLFESRWFHLQEDIRREAVAAARVLAWLAPLGILSSYFSTLVMAQGDYRNTLVEALPAAAILAALFAPAGWVPAPLLWGTVAGFALQVAVLGRLAGTSADLARIRTRFQSPAWNNFGRTVFVMVLGQAIASLSVVIDQFFAVRIGAGAASSLSYASRVAALILGMGAIGISRATLYVFSEVHEKNRLRLHGLGMKWSALGFAIGLLTTVACWVAAPLIITLLFERGAFTPENTTVVSHLLRISAAQFPFYFAATVLMNYLASAAAYRKIAIATMLALAAKVAFLYLPLPWTPIEVLAGSAVVYIFVLGIALLLPSLQLGARPGHQDKAQAEDGPRS
ncbi:MAG: lipid II flippase MurJ [Ramlibacter sp.]